MMTAKKVEKNTIQSFNLVKQEISVLAKRVAYLEGELAISKLRAKVPSSTLVSSVASSKVHVEQCGFAKKIKPLNKVVVDLVGNDPCACVV